MLIARSFLVAAVALVASSCNSATSPIDQSSIPVLTTVSPLWDSNIDAYAYGLVRPPPAVSARDQFGRGMAGVKVSFAITAGGGQLLDPETITSPDGIAQLRRWILGPVGGENIVVATAGQFTASFRVVAKPVPGDVDPCYGCWDYTRVSARELKAP